MGGRKKFLKMPFGQIHIKPNTWKMTVRSRKRAPSPFQQCMQANLQGRMVTRAQAQVQTPFGAKLSIEQKNANKDRFINGLQTCAGRGKRRHNMSYGANTPGIPTNFQHAMGPGEKPLGGLSAPFFEATGQFIPPRRGP